MLHDICDLGVDVNLLVIIDRLHVAAHGEVAVVVDYGLVSHELGDVFDVTSAYIGIEDVFAVLLGEPVLVAAVHEFT